MCPQVNSCRTCDGKEWVGLSMSLPWDTVSQVKLQEQLRSMFFTFHPWYYLRGEIGQFRRWRFRLPTWALQWMSLFQPWSQFENRLTEETCRTLQFSAARVSGFDGGWRRSALSKGLEGTLLLVGLQPRMFSVCDLGKSFGNRSLFQHVSTKWIDIEVQAWYSLASGICWCKALNKSIPTAFRSKPWWI